MTRIVNWCLDCAATTNDDADDGSHYRLRRFDELTATSTLVSLHRGAARGRG